MLSTSIKKLVTYGLETGLLPECETSYATNLILDLFHDLLPVSAQADDRNETLSFGGVLFCPDLRLYNAHSYMEGTQ